MVIHAYPVQLSTGDCREDAVSQCKYVRRVATALHSQYIVGKLCYIFSPYIFVFFFSSSLTEFVVFDVRLKHIQG